MELLLEFVLGLAFELIVDNKKIGKVWKFFIVCLIFLPIAALFSWLGILLLRDAKPWPGVLCLLMAVVLPGV